MAELILELKNEGAVRYCDCRESKPQSRCRLNGYWCNLSLVKPRSGWRSLCLARCGRSRWRRTRLHASPWMRLLQTSTVCISTSCFPRSGSPRSLGLRKLCSNTRARQGAELASRAVGDFHVSQRGCSVRLELRGAPVAWLRGMQCSSCLQTAHWCEHIASQDLSLT